MTNNNLQTHTVCQTRLKRDGGKSECCFCKPHKDCDLESSEYQISELSDGTKINQDDFIKERLEEFNELLFTYRLACENYEVALLNRKPNLQKNLDIIERLKDRLNNYFTETIELTEAKERKRFKELIEKLDTDKPGEFGNGFAFAMQELLDLLNKFGKKHKVEMDGTSYTATID